MNLILCLQGVVLLISCTRLLWLQKTIYAAESAAYKVPGEWALYDFLFVISPDTCLHYIISKQQYKYSYALEAASFRSEHNKQMKNSAYFFFLLFFTLFFLVVPEKKSYENYSSVPAPFLETIYQICPIMYS